MLAMKLANQLYEVDAEFALRVQYPSLAESRAQYYCDFRAESEAWSSFNHPFRAYASLHERLRGDLALELVGPNGLRRSELVALRDRLDAEIAALDAAVRQRLNNLDAILSPTRTDFDRLSQWGPDAYRFVVTNVLTAVSGAAAAS